MSDQRTMAIRRSLLAFGLTTGLATVVGAGLGDLTGAAIGAAAGMLVPLAPRFAKGARDRLSNVAATCAFVVQIVGGVVALALLHALASGAAAVSVVAAPTLRRCRAAARPVADALARAAGAGRAFIAGLLRMPALPQTLANAFGAVVIAGNVAQFDGAALALPLALLTMIVVAFVGEFEAAAARGPGR
ncbi:MAG: hypothetical protein IPK81_11830 [Rhodospirillales bacterium]|nr:MAG: hypothetical protein IPK81_11830 [Rhodospirillales bacterium]